VRKAPLATCFCKCRSLLCVYRALLSVAKPAESLWRHVLVCAYGVTCGNALFVPCACVFCVKKCRALLSVYRALSSVNRAKYAEITSCDLCLYVHMVCVQK